MDNVLADFVRVLRNAGVRVCAAETMDAARALEHVGYRDRALVHDALAASLAKTPDDKRLFECCFTQFFSGAISPFITETGDSPNAPGIPDEQGLPAGLRITDLVGTGAAMRLQLAIDAAARRAGIEAMSSFTQRGLYVRRTLDQLGWQALQQHILQLDPSSAEADGERLAADRLRQTSDLLRTRVREHVERHYRLHADANVRELHESVLRTARLSLLEERDLERIGHIVRRIARRLAARHARRRRECRHGLLDVPRTLRAGVAHDGLLFAPRWRNRRRDRPALIALCDISGSVHAYARFLLLFLYGLGDVLPRVRSFVFSARIAETSELFAQHPPEAALAIAQRSHGHGSTDYGVALRGLLEAAGRDLDRGATVVILGDGRNNRADPALSTLREIKRRAQRLIWLVPEPASLWGTGDSEMLRYRSACSEVRVVQSIRQLERFADDLLRGR